MLNEISAIILAAGSGSRLGILTADIPKPMLRFGKKPFLEYILLWLLRSGIKDVVVVGYTHFMQLEAYISSNNFYHGKVRLIKLRQLGTTVDSAKVGLEAISKTHSYLMTCDSLWTVDLSAMYHDHISSSALATVLVTNRKDFANQGAIKVFADNTIAQLWASPEAVLQPNVSFISGSTMGLYLVNAQATLSAIKTSDSSIEREPLNRLIPRVRAFWNEGFFLDYGTPENYALLYKDPELITNCWGTLI